MNIRWLLLKLFEYKESIFKWFFENVLNKLGAAHRFAESEISIHYRSPIRNLQQANQHRVYYILN